MSATVAILGLAVTAAARNCIDIAVSVALRPQQVRFEIQPPTTEIGIVDLILDATVQLPVIPPTQVTQTKTYRLATTYCSPDSGPGKGLQILTHGLGFDKAYWDWDAGPINGGRIYSYVDHALSHGYATLSWDRVGFGGSSRGHPIDEIQLFLELDALAALTSWVRRGGLPGGQHRGSKLVHVGHSFGSALTAMVASQHPGLTDGIVLTGFSQVYAFLPNFILASNFISVKKRPWLSVSYSEGYVTPQSAVGVQTDFFGPHNFDPVVMYQATARRVPIALGEMMTLAYVSSESNFTGPVLIITGNRDLPFCGGNCSNPAIINNMAANLLEAARPNFASASVLETNVVPRAGHALNLEFTAPLTYDMVLDFIDRNLPSSYGSRPFGPRQ
ncbi:catalytic protein [Ophiocordyceps camponoti-floridani]|uniref:Catalytic protein n=1 Tax=Ophiocordyceps camponoti-floridani TaxID=2030778 RepID=A0A8H4Q0N8_9HYPO|nr:catalytic protein [Ophiocordyceps camponoti-floridani]